MLGRVNRTSALWQQFAFLCDLIVLSADGTARYYEELPLAYVLAFVFGFGFNGVFIAVPVAESALALAAIVLFRRGKWKLKKV